METGRHKDKTRIVNHTEKNIRDFKKSDTIFIRKMINGYNYDLLCKFVKFEKGVVTAQIIDVQQLQNKFQKKQIVTSRLKGCYLWAGDTSFFEKKILGCKWFQKDGYAK